MFVMLLYIYLYTWKVWWLNAYHAAVVSGTWKVRSCVCFSVILYFFYVWVFLILIHVNLRYLWHQELLWVFLVFYLWKQQKFIENTYFLLSFSNSPDSNWLNSFPSAPPYSSQWETLLSSILLYDSWKIVMNCLE